MFENIITIKTVKNMEDDNIYKKKQSLPIQTGRTNIDYRVTALEFVRN